MSSSSSSSVAAAAAAGLIIPYRRTLISHHTLRRLPKPSVTKRRHLLPTISSSSVGVGGKQELSFTEEPETALLDALLGIQGRGRSASPQQLEDVERAVRALEDLKGVAEPTSSSLIEGRWQLIFTTRPGTASPIQRTFVGVDTFRIFQEVYLKTDDPRVSNIVKFSDAIGELKVEAAATIKDGKRILFRFDRAAFSFKFLPFKVPYPVPFRLLGDEAKGWLDTTYLSAAGDMRISRGNKGTTFVLQKNTKARQRLLSSISVGDGVMEVIDEILCLNQSTIERDTDALEGEWQLLWASQTDDESWENIASDGLKGLQIVKGNSLKNQIDIFPGFKLHSSGNLIRRSNSNMYDVTMNDGAVIVGPFKFPLNTRGKFDLELLYMDNKIRITRGKNDVLLVHLHLDRAQTK